MAIIAKTDRLLRRVVIICEMWLLRKTAVVKGGCCEGRLNRKLIRVAKIKKCEGPRTLLRKDTKFAVVAKTVQNRQRSRPPQTSFPPRHVGGEKRDNRTENVKHVDVGSRREDNMEPTYSYFQVIICVLFLRYE